MRRTTRRALAEPTTHFTPATVFGLAGVLVEFSVAVSFALFPFDFGLALLWVLLGMGLMGLGLGLWAVQRRGA